MYDTNNKALQIAGPAVGANNYSIYSNATAQSYFAGDIGQGDSSPQGNQQWSDAQGHGGLVLKSYSADATITANATITAQVNVPTGAKVVGVQLHVKTALAGGNTWDAAFTNIATTAIATNQAVAQNTNVSFFYDVSAATDIATGEVDVAITKNAGGAFTATGVIEVIIYAYIFDTWDDEA